MKIRSLIVSVAVFCVGSLLYTAASAMYRQSHHDRLSENRLFLRNMQRYPKKSDGHFQRMLYNQHYRPHNQYGFRRHPGQRRYTAFDGLRRLRQMRNESHNKYGHHHPGQHRYSTFNNLQRLRQMRNESHNKYGHHHPGQHRYSTFNNLQRLRQMRNESHNKYGHHHPGQRRYTAFDGLRRLRQMRESHNKYGRHHPGQGRYNAFHRFGSRR